MAAQDSSGSLLAQIKIKIDGSEVDPEIYDKVAEAKVIDSLHVPDVAHVRFHDKANNLSLIDDAKFKPGADLEIHLLGTAAGADASAKTMTQVFKGTITSIEPVFQNHNVSLLIRAFDRSQKLFQGKKNRVFQKQSLKDIASKVLKEAGFTADVENTPGGQLDFVQQANESDWDFLSKMAKRFDMEILMDDKKAVFKTASRARDAAPVLEWGVNLESFVARVTSAQVPDEVVVTAHDAKTQKQFKGTSKLPPTPEAKLGFGDASIQKERKGRVVNLTIAADSQEEVNALAKSAAARYARSTLEANGAATGDAKLKAGTEVEIKGIGQRFSGKYVLSQTTHVYRGNAGYTTQFTISGAPRTLSALLSGGSSNGAKSGGGGGGGGGFEGLTVGVVTNNSDPDKNGRVKVKYPTQADQSLESTWARVVMPSARKDAGFGVIPQVNDEVIVGFEHGDLRRPYVLGSVWGGKDKGGADVLDHKEGSIQGKTPGGFRMHAAKDMKMVTDDKFHMESKGDLFMKAGKGYMHKAGMDIKIEAGTNVEIKAGANMTIKSNAPLKIEAPAIEISASGVLTLKGASVAIG